MTVFLHLHEKKTVRKYAAPPIGKALKRENPKVSLRKQSSNRYFPGKTS